MFIFKALWVCYISEGSERMDSDELAHYKLLSVICMLWMKQMEVGYDRGRKT